MLPCTSTRWVELQNITNNESATLKPRKDVWVEHRTASLSTNFDVLSTLVSGSTGLIHTTTKVYLMKNRRTKD
jgi:hypothetical protein